MHQLCQLPLTEHRIRNIQAPILPLHRLVHPRRVAHPIVRLPRERKLDRAQRVRNVFDRVREAVRKVIRRVDDPVCTGAHVRRRLDDAVRDGVPQVRVAALHVHLEAERRLAGLKLAEAHVLKQAKALLDGAVAVRRLGALAARVAAARSVHLLGGLVAHIRLVALDHVDGNVVQLLEIVRRRGHLVRLEAEPVDALENARKVRLVLGFGVGVVKAEVAVAVVDFGVAKVKVHGLGVANVEEAVRLGGEAGLDKAAGGLEVSGHEGGVDLGVLAGLVELEDFAFKDARLGSGARRSGIWEKSAKRRSA